MLGTSAIDADVLGARILGGCGRRWLLLGSVPGSPSGVRHFYVVILLGKLIIYLRE